MLNTAKLEAISQRIRNKTHDDCSLSEPSCKLNTAATSSYPSCTSSKDYSHKLTHEEGQLLINNKGCTKCHKPFVFHMKDDDLPKNKCDFPKGTSYQPITQALVDAACHSYKGKKGKQPVAAITSIHSLSYALTSSPSPLHNAVASPSVHPVAAIMGYASNPVGYKANYSSSVFADNEGDNTMSDVHVPVAVIIEHVNGIVESGSSLKVMVDPTALLSILHLFW